jgi:hypothetical protein
MSISPPCKMNDDPFTSSINNTPKLHTSLFGDTCFEVRIFGAMYPIVFGVKVEANVI